MAKHEIQAVIPNVKVTNADMEVTVRSDGVLLGRLKISKGTIDWLPANNSKNHYVMNWEKFALTMEESGSRRTK